MFVFRLEQLIKSQNRMRWVQSSGNLLVPPLALCPLYSLINVVGAYSITPLLITTPKLLTRLLLGQQDKSTSRTLAFLTHLPSPLQNLSYTPIRPTTLHTPKKLQCLPLQHNLHW